MIASSTAEDRQIQVTVRCKVPGGPWFVWLGGPGGTEVELGPYENPAVAREDARKLRQFLALIPTRPQPRPGDRDSGTAVRDSGHRSSAPVVSSEDWAGAEHPT